VLVALVLQVHLILSSEAVVVAVEVKRHRPALVALVVAVLVATTTTTLRLLEPRILAVVAVVAQTAQAVPLKVKRVALALSKFVIRMHLGQPHQLQVRPQLQYRVGIVFTHSPLLVQSHSEEQHGTFCKSRKRHRHTSYCGGARCN
jgi:hypothetical protein